MTTSYDSDGWWMWGLVATLLAILFFVITIIVTNQRNAAWNTECSSGHYVTASSGQLVKLDINGHTYGDLRCKS